MDSGFAAARRPGMTVLLPFPHVDEMPRDRRGGRHGRRDQVGAALVALAPLEIAVRGRGAAFAGIELVGIHREAHRAAGLAPLEAGFDEDLVEAFGFGLLFYPARARAHPPSSPCLCRSSA